ncbi:MAG: MarR family transcriptional regulator [Blautia sp.]|nr:MarR family transcriptional regulator [Blautia sp.]
MEDQEKMSLKLENQLCFPLYACARKVTNLYTPYLKPLGLTYTQYVTFMVLWEKDGISIGELGQTLYLDSGTLTPLLKKMEEKGYVTRSRSAKDERVVTIHLTEKGYALKDQVADVPSKVGPCVKLSPEEGAALYDLLYRLLGNLQD